MNRLAATGAVLLLGLLLAGCPESVHPITDPAKAAADPALHGAWHGTFDDEEIYLHVGPGERGMTKATLVEYGKEAKIKTERYLAFPSAVGRLALLNVRRVDEPERSRGYTLFKYRVAGGKLTLWMLSYAAARDDIKAGKLTGKAEDGPFGETLITAPSAELAKYLQEGDPARLFDKPLVFNRVPRP
jgi:hypothetical protein